MTNLIRSFSSSDLYSENQILWSTDLTNDIWFDAHAIKREIEDKVSPPENLPETGKVISIMDLPKCNLHLIGQRVENGSPEAKTVSVLVKHTEEGSKDFTIWATGGVQIAVFSRRDWSFISGVAISTGVEQCQGGWIRLSATFSVENNDIYFGTSEGKNSRYVGENKKQFYVYAPQYEWSESSTSYIPTLSQISCHPGKVTSGGFHSTINLLALLEDLVTSYQGSQSFFSLFKVAFQGFQHSRFFTFGLKLLHRALKAGKLSIEECVVLQEGLIKNAKNISSKDLIKYLASFTTTLFNDELPWQALELFQQQIHLFTPQFKGLSNAQVEGKVLVQDFKESIETEEYEKVWFILNCSSSQQTITSFKEYLKASKFDTDKVRDFCNSPGNSELEFLLLDGLKKDDEVRLSNLGLSYQLLNLVDLDDENLENILISLSQLKSKGTIIKRQYCYSQTRFSCWEPVNNPSTEFAFTVPEFKKSTQWIPSQVKFLNLEILL
ncbi:MAG: hypothetical protein HC769_02225 [Cyanobacteria bacterium CRU_2_1]|nr:hypothetical protein [Cyanobacteria bacterium CRU_2_1]